MENYWSTYWKQGKLHSFADAPGENYDGDLAERWLKFFNTYSGTNATLVDIGCGNGALFGLALTQPKMDDVAFIGVDTASLTIPESLNHTNLTFLQNTPAENTGIDASSVDAVISQFGMEYSDTDQAFSESARILKKGGKLQIIVHDTASMIIKRNARTLGVINALNQRDSALDALRQLLNAINKYGKNTPVAEKARHALNHAMDLLVKQFGQQAVIDTNFQLVLKATLNPATKYADKKAALKKFEHELNGQQVRLSELVNAAFSSDKKQHAQQTLDKLGFKEVAFEAVNEEKRLIGCEISAVKG